MRRGNRGMRNRQDVDLVGKRLYGGRGPEIHGIGARPAASGHQVVERVPSDLAGREGVSR